MLNTKSWSRKHPDTRPFPSQPNIYATQSSSLQPTAHAHVREVQNTCMDGPFESSNETWPYSSTVAFGTRDRSGTENCSSDVNQWYYPETSSVPKAIHHSESSAENTSLLDNSSAMTHSYTKRSANSSLPWKFTYPNMTATLPFIDDGDQRVPTCNEYLGCSKRLEQRAVPTRKGSTEYTSPPDSSTAMPHLKVSASSSFPWNVTHDHPNMTETLPFIHQSDNRIAFRDGDSGPSKLLDQRAVPYFAAPQPPNAELSRPQMSPQDLEYTSLLDDLMAVLNEDLLATQNNTTVPPLLPSLAHSDTFHSQAVNDELLNAITSMPSDQQLNMAGVSNINNHMHDHFYRPSSQLVPMDV